MKEKPIICTIIAKNYLASARVLCDSFLKQHPNGDCYVLIVDNFKGYIFPEKEKFKIVKLSDLGIKRVENLCLKYNITELCTAVKPYFLKYLLDKEKYSKIIYLDPDILVTNRLDNLYKELDNSDILLTPHTTKDYPQDEKLPKDSLVFLTGMFNLGFIGLKNCENTSKFLLWWQKKLYDKCIVAYSEGYFVDQKFIDFASIIFPNIKIISHEGYNVACWNLHSRKIEFDKEWKCNGDKLYFYHFSGYNPYQPQEISKHQNRSKLNDPSLSKLFNLYRNLILAAGYDISRKWEYNYDFMSNGSKIPYLFRKFYRENVDRLKIKNPFELKNYAFSDKIKFWIASIVDKGLYDFIMKIKKQVYHMFI